jgi:hypothetical protein
MFTVVWYKVVNKIRKVGLVKRKVFKEWKIARQNDNLDMMNEGQEGVTKVRGHASKDKKIDRGRNQTRSSSAVLQQRVRQSTRAVHLPGSRKWWG